jgi:hypothetical protein
VKQPNVAQHLGKKHYHLKDGPQTNPSADARNSASLSTPTTGSVYLRSTATVLDPEKGLIKLSRNTKLASNSKTHAEQDSTIQFVRFGSKLSSRPWVRVLNNLDTRSHNNDLMTIIASRGTIRTSNPDSIPARRNATNQKTMH